uniref:Uncharacterized protein n=1 Tax=Sphaerodactylus townsendi TaxID=933632 RepID=A0ACB8F8B5_9SAUR
MHDKPKSTIPSPRQPNPARETLAAAPGWQRGASEGCFLADKQLVPAEAWPGTLRGKWDQLLQAKGMEQPENSERSLGVEPGPASPCCLCRLKHPRAQSARLPLVPAGMTGTLQGKWDQLHQTKGMEQPECNERSLEGAAAAAATCSNSLSSASSETSMCSEAEKAPVLGRRHSCRRFIWLKIFGCRR